MWTSTYILLELWNRVGANSDYKYFHKSLLATSHIAWLVPEEPIPKEGGEKSTVRVKIIYFKKTQVTIQNTPTINFSYFSNSAIQRS